MIDRKKLGFFVTREYSIRNVRVEGGKVCADVKSSVDAQYSACVEPSVSLSRQDSFCLEGPFGEPFAVFRNGRCSEIVSGPGRVVISGVEQEIQLKPVPDGFYPEPPDLGDPPPES